MPGQIRLESIASEPPVEIMQADAGPITIGRGPDNHIVVDSDAVSRVHGSLLSTSEVWVFKDFESTNGSWINGVKLAPGQLRIVRHGDVIQLADFPMRVREVAPRADRNTGPFVLVFYDEHYEADFPLDAAGAKFAIGGPAGQFFIEGVPGEEPQLEIVNSGWQLEAVAHGVRVPVIVNSMAATGVTALSDRDEVIIGPYRLLVSDPRSASPGDPSLTRPGAGTSPQARGGVQAYDRPSAIHRIREEGMGDDVWESEAARRKASGKKFVFGSDPGEDETTNTIGLGYQYPSGTGFEMSTSQRFSQAVFEAESQKPNPVTETVLTLFGILIFLIVIALCIYFFMFVM